jgi:hypothetical protein
VPQRLAIRCFVIALALIAIGYATAFTAIPAITRAGEWCMVLGIAGTSVAALGFFDPSDPRRRRIFRGALVFTFLALVIGLGLPLAMERGTAATEGLVWGLPLRVAIVVYLAGFAPLIVLPVAYALAFEVDDPANPTPRPAP